jgi:hypothetical protein
MATETGTTYHSAEAFGIPNQPLQIKLAINPIF